MLKDNRRAWRYGESTISAERAPASSPHEVDDSSPMVAELARGFLGDPRVEMLAEDGKSLAPDKPVETLVPEPESQPQSGPASAATGPASSPVTQGARSAALTAAQRARIAELLRTVHTGTMEEASKAIEQLEDDPSDEATDAIIECLKANFGAKPRPTGKHWWFINLDNKLGAALRGRTGLGLGADPAAWEAWRRTTRRHP